MAEPPSTWVRISTGYYDDPRIIAVGEAAELLFVRAIAWSKRNRSDGWLPGDCVDRLVARGGRARADRLVEVGAFEVDPERGGYVIRSYASWQETTVEIEAQREELRRRGRRGAEARWHGNGDGPGHSGGHSGGHGAGDGQQMTDVET
jgi:hypothetical protein